jgi:hypothetical protein
MESINSGKKHFCQICNKEYSSRSSLSNHKKNHHQEDHKRKKDSEDNCYYCRYCDKSYKTCQSRWNHEKKCIYIEKTNGNEIDEILEENQKLKDYKLKQAEQIIKLQNKIIKANSLDAKTFKAINKVLMNRSNNSHNNMITNSNNNITNTNTSNSNNTINNNIQQICNIGNEELVKVLTNEQKKQIMGAKLNALEKIVEIAHCGEYKQFKNIIITNLKNNYAYKYDKERGYFITIEKNDLLDDIVLHRITDIEAIYDEIKSAKELDKETRHIIQSFFTYYNSDDPYVDENDVEYPNFKSYKQNSIKILIYNNRDKITKDIALLISENNE